MVQESLDRLRVVMTLPEITLDRDEVATFCESKGSWSPDGRYLAVPRPGGNRNRDRVARARPGPQDSRPGQPALLVPGSQYPVVDLVLSRLVSLATK